MRVKILKKTIDDRKNVYSLLEDRGGVEVNQLGYAMILLHQVGVYRLEYFIITIKTS
ncbi:MAG: hypothetical protein ABI045_01000 [Flavobacteriales bacterium]